MTSDKKSVALLADLFVKHGLSDIVISPGSRNAPIIISFAGKPEINSYSIIDERSAAFYALGIAQQKEKAAAVACTSGTAVLNYAPAIAEAYYQKIPLLILTADRPTKFIDIGDGQCIRQKDVYNNYIKASFQLPENLNTDASFNIANKIINRAIHLTHFPEPGPVHINIPFNEPLYNTSNEAINSIKEKYHNRRTGLSDSNVKLLAEKWNRYNKILLIAGQQNKNESLNKVLNELTESKNVILLTETTSNIYGENFISCIDNVLSAVKPNETGDFTPELLITFGQHVVSKKIKKFLRENKPLEHWHISVSGDKLDTYFALTKVINEKPDDFFSKIAKYITTSKPWFLNKWLRKRNRVKNLRDDFLANIEYSDLNVFDIIFEHIPIGTILHLGNSTPVRYSQLFGTNEWITYRSNRGVSGIDGHISTAAGSALASNDMLNLVITGDLGFFYDMNGLMNIPPNLKIIVINNGGGGIFRFIPGPDTSPYLEKFFEVKHNRKVEMFAKAFDVKYFKAYSITDIIYSLPEFFNENEKPVIMEIITPGEKNAVILREYFKHLSK
jgi:2-succinyl-5-enolpyruvyl-6-hydroxy-3-cyclohexene-1-carboxylate synthase